MDAMVGSFLQSSQHISRADNVDTNASVRPLHCQTGGQMPYSSLGCIVWRLWLRDVHNGAGHGSNHDHGALYLTFKEMSSYLTSEEVCTIHIDAPQLPHPLWWILNGIKILRKAGGCDQVIDLAMVFDNIANHRLDRFGV